jgi:hypothetical protein
VNARESRQSRLRRRRAGAARTEGPDRRGGVAMGASAETADGAHIGTPQARQRMADEGRVPVKKDTNCRAHLPRSAPPSQPSSAFPSRRSRVRDPVVCFARGPMTAGISSLPDGRSPHLTIRGGDLTSPNARLESHSFGARCGVGLQHSGPFANPAGPRRSAAWRRPKPPSAASFSPRCSAPSTSTSPSAGAPSCISASSPAPRRSRPSARAPGGRSRPGSGGSPRPPCRPDRRSPSRRSACPGRGGTRRRSPW